VQNPLFCRGGDIWQRSKGQKNLAGGADRKKIEGGKNEIWGQSTGQKRAGPPQRKHFGGERGN